MNVLRLDAASIVVDISANGMVSTITLFQPTKTTRMIIDSLKAGDQFRAIELVDYFDDGTRDVHTSDAGAIYIGEVGEDSRKMHTPRLVFSAP